jgi:hypothetical protein
MVNVKNKIALIALFIILLVGCNKPSNSPSFAPSQESTPFKLPPTWTPTITNTPRPSATPIVVETFTPVPPIPLPTLSAIDTIVDEYLTAIQHDNWQGAYDYLCPAIQARIRTPEEMYRRILVEIGSIPDSHRILPAPDRPYRVLFILSRTDATGKWVSGEREARLEEGSLKICGVGATHGDLRYLLQIDNVEPLNINP